MCGKKSSTICFFSLKGQGWRGRGQSIKLRKTAGLLGAVPTPSGRLFRLCRTSRKGWEFPGWLTSPGPSLEVGGLYRGSMTLHPHCQLQPHSGHLGTEHGISYLQSNSTRISPFAKTKSIWHQAFGAYSKRGWILGILQPNPAAPHLPAFLPR